MEKNSLREVSKQSGVPLSTLSRWKKEGKLAPDVAGDKDELTLYSEAVIELARKLDQERKAKTADKTECACASDNGDNSDGEQAVEVVDDREDDGSNDDDDDRKEIPSVVSESAEGDDELQDPPADDELPESVTTPAQIVTGEVNSIAEGNPPMTIETAAEIITLDVRANRIRKLQADVQRGIIEIGFELIAAKKEIGHGNFGRWLQNEFEWTERTARNFMAMAARFGTRKTFSNLKPSTLQAMLALPTGEEDKFIASQADKGKPIEEMTAREVKQAVKKWKSEPPSTISPFEKDDAQEVSGEYLRILPNAPTIEDAVQNLPQVNSESQEPRKKKLPPISHNFNGSVNYFTPAQYIKAARAVLGVIDLDPASCVVANETVKAAQIFTADDNGLNQEWRGRIWLNPPFANGLIGKFVDKLIAEIDSGSVTSAIVLVDNATETQWFQKLAEKCAGLVFTNHRINFLKEGKSEEGSPTRGQVFLYFGDDVEKFFLVFKQFGMGMTVHK